MKKTLSTVLILIFATLIGFAQSGYKPTEGNLKTRKEYQDNKFGIFLHWGIYSMMADGEWVMQNKDINYKEYSKMAAGFYPIKFDAAQWVSAIKASGAKYICITSRHHDGFSMFDSKYTDYNIVKATPFKRDILKELAEECAKQGIKLHIYYSHLDWYREDYPLGKYGLNVGRPVYKGSIDSYYKFMNNQLTELLTNYGPIGAIWFDGCWDHDADPNFWNFAGQYSLIHKLQPNCLIGNNHHLKPFEGEDFQIFEGDLPGENTAGFSGKSTISRLPLETCATMESGHWGYKNSKQGYKSASTMIQFLVKAAGKNANLLLNIGPQPDGELPEMSVERLQEIGKWMNQYGETIYGTRGGSIAPHDWGVTTQKNNKLFIHILKLQDKELFLPFSGKVKKAILFKDKKPVTFIKSKGGVLLEFNEVPNDVDYVVELTIG